MFIPPCTQIPSPSPPQNPTCPSPLRPATTNHLPNMHNTRPSSTRSRPASSSSASSTMALSSSWSLFQQRRPPYASFFPIPSCRTLPWSSGKHASCTFSQSQRAALSTASYCRYKRRSNSGPLIWSTTGVANTILNTRKSIFKPSFKFKAHIRSPSASRTDHSSVWMQRRLVIKPQLVCLCFLSFASPLLTCIQRPLDRESVSSQYIPYIAYVLPSPRLHGWVTYHRISEPPPAN